MRVFVRLYTGLGEAKYRELGIGYTGKKKTISMATGTGGPSGEFDDTYYQCIRINFSQVKV